MNDEETQKAITNYRLENETKHSISPRKYHGPELKCSGPGLCRDCTDRVKNGIGFDDWNTPKNDTLSNLLPKPENKEENQKDANCTCSSRSLYWNGCICKDPSKKKVSIKR